MEPAYPNSLEIRLGLTVMPGRWRLGVPASRYSCGLRVHVLHPVDAHPFTLIRSCAQLKALGVEPVPRIFVRTLRNEEELGYLLLGLVEISGVQEVLLSDVAINEPRGRYASSLDVIGRNIIQRYGITKIGVEAVGDPHAQLCRISRFLNPSPRGRGAKKLRIYFAMQPGAGLEEAALWAESLRAGGHRFPVLASIVLAGAAQSPTYGAFGLEGIEPMDNAVAHESGATAMFGRLASDHDGIGVDGVCLYAPWNSGGIDESVLQFANGRPHPS